MQMYSSFISRWASVLIGLPLLLGVLAGIYRAGYAELQHRPDNIRQQAQSVVDRLSSALEVKLFGLERSTGLFAQANRSLLESLLQQPDNPALLDKLRSELASVFPKAHSATISTTQGESLVELELGLMGEVCRHDLLAFMDASKPRELFLHPVCFLFPYLL